MTSESQATDVKESTKQINVQRTVDTDVNTTAASINGGNSIDSTKPTVGKKTSMMAAGSEIVGQPKERLAMRPMPKTVVNNLVNNFAQNAFITGVNQLKLSLDSDGSDDEESETDSVQGMSPRSKKQYKARKKYQAAMGVTSTAKAKRIDAAAANNIYQEDPNQLDLVKSVTSIQMIKIADRFDAYPGEELDLSQFVETMKEVIGEGDNPITRRDDFIQQLVDLFYRSNKLNLPTIKFADLTAYLIEHEIANYTEDATQIDMHYEESADITDPTQHNGQIEKIYYFEKIDKVILFETNMCKVRIYDAVKMRAEPEIKCSDRINAIEFISERNCIAISLSDLTIRFYDILSNNENKRQNRFLRTLHVPSTQKCLSYVKTRKKQLLFSGGTQGAVFAWNIELFFAGEYKLQPGDPDYEQNKDGAMAVGPGGRKKKEVTRDDQRKEYITYRCEHTPWFVYDFILCLQYLPNINQLATGVYDGKIHLWDLRQKQVDQGNAVNPMDPQQTMADSLTAAERAQQKTNKKNIQNYFRDQTLTDETYSDHTVSPIKTLVGHKRAVREMAYSEKHKVLLSCGFDFNVFVWNPYLPTPIIQLEGHDNPLIGVNCLNNLDCFITADSGGPDIKPMIKLWNILDYSCIQTFYVTDAHEVKSIRAVPKHRRLIVGARNFTVFQYTRPFQPEFTDDKTVCRVIFSEKRLEIFVAGEKNIKVWDARTGKPIRIIKNVFNDEITEMVFDKHHRKLIVGSDHGHLRIFDLQSGIMNQELEAHYAEGQISFIGYGGDDNTIITCGWDRTIKIHMDEMVSSKTPTEMVKRGKPECHKKDIICGSYAHNLGLIATGSQDCRVKVWDYERVILLDEFVHKNEVQLVHFIHPFPLLVTADSSGTMRIWVVRPPPPLKPHPCHHQLVTKLDNMSIEKEVPITAIDSHYDEREGKLLLIQGDENGEICVHDLTPILTRVPELVPMDITVNNLKRNPHREFPIEREERKRRNRGAAQDSDSDLDESQIPRDTPLLVEEKLIKQIVKKSRVHSDLIKSIQYISCTDRPLILTGSTDKLVHIIDMNAHIVGTLKQGYKSMANYQWDFPTARYFREHPERQTRMQKILEEVRIKRHKDLSHKKLKEIELLQSGRLNSIGVSGAVAGGLGMGDSMFNTQQSAMGGTERKPRYAGGNTSAAASDYNSNTFGGGYNPSASQYSSMRPRQAHFLDVLSRGKDFLKKQAQSKERAARRQATRDARENRKGVDEEAKLEEEVIEAYRVRQENLQRIGSFRFDIDNELDIEKLTREQVFEDLEDINNIREKTGDPEANNAAQKAKIMAMYTRGKKKKKGDMGSKRR